MVEFVLGQPGVKVDGNAMYQALLLDTPAADKKAAKKGKGKSSEGAAATIASTSLLYALLTSAGGALTSVGVGGSSALHFAAIAKQGDVVKHILRTLPASDARSTVNAVNRAGLTALQAMLQAAKDGECEPAPDDADGENVGAIKDIVVALIAAGANVNVTDNEGNTPLHIAGAN